MNELIFKQVHPDIFLVQENNEGVVYAPLLGKFFPVRQEGLDIIANYLEKGKPQEHRFYRHLLKEGFFKIVEHPRIGRKGPLNSREVTLSVTSACNLRCIYCYANAGINSLDLPWEIIEKSIQQVFQFARERGDNEVELGFHGTGETLVRWNVMVAAVNYALSLLPEGWKINFSLVTNGTLIDDEKAKYLKKHNFSVVLSMDGIKKVQDRLRPKANGEGSFEDVLSGMRFLVKNEVSFAVRTTITAINQDNMLEFVELCAVNGCREISASPFSMTGRGVNGIADVDPKIFVRNYLKAKERSRELGIEFTTPSDGLDNASARYCNADGESMAVMPEGIISACTRVTRSEDALSELFIVGEINMDGVIIHEEKVESLKDLNLYKFSECSDCFVKYTCSGGCHHTRLINGGKQPTSYCMIIRAVVWDTLRNAAFNPTVLK
jgi:uncharacterized protein